MGVCGKDHCATAKKKKKLKEQLLRLHRRPLARNQVPATIVIGEDKGRKQTASRRTAMDGLSSLPGSGADAQGLKICKLSAALQILARAAHRGSITGFLSAHVSPFMQTKGAEKMILLLKHTNAQGVLAKVLKSVSSLHFLINISESLKKGCTFKIF